MTKQEYLSKKGELDYQYSLLSNYLDDLGFSAYQDESGDFGSRRLLKETSMYEIWIMDMVGDYWAGEYPDGQFLGKTRSPTADVWLRSKEEIDLFLNNPDNYSYKIER